MTGFNSIKESFRGRIVLITGGNGGLGKALVTFFLECGSKVLATARDSAKAASLKRSFSHYENFKTAVLDLTEIESVNDFYKDIEKRLGHIDILINNAGIYNIDPKIAACDKPVHLMVNFVSTIYLTEKLMPLILKSETKKAVFVSSVSSGYFKFDDSFIEPKGKLHCYAKSKQLCAMSALQLADLYRSEGLKIAIAHPGVCATNIVNRGNFFDRKIATSAMKLLFSPPAKSALSIAVAAAGDIENNMWCGPRVLKTWGKPKIYKNYPQICQKQNMEKAYAYYKKLLEETLKREV